MFTVLSRAESKTLAAAIEAQRVLFNQINQVQLARTDLARQVKFNGPLGSTAVTSTLSGVESPTTQNGPGDSQSKAPSPEALREAALIERYFGPKSSVN